MKLCLDVNLLKRRPSYRMQSLIFEATVIVPDPTPGQISEPGIIVNVLVPKNPRSQHSKQQRASLRTLLEAIRMAPDPREENYLSPLTSTANCFLY